MIADAVDEHDHLFGVRREALYAAALMIGAKAATGVGAFLAGLGLQLVGFSTPAEGAGPAAVPESIAAALGLLWGPGAAALMLAAIPFLWRYRVSRVRHAEVLASLALRRLERNGALPDCSAPAHKSSTLVRGSR
jgi:GPH family glycoside/pentoside/hexuronide:cation symporter